MNKTTSTAAPKSSHRPSGRRQLLLAGMTFAAVALSLAAAQAQSTKIFVASFGNDANDGSRNAPKRNFQAAHDAVATGGQIVVLDTAGYGALSINKSISVTVPPGVTGFITATGNGNGVLINAGSGASVALRGLIVEGGGASGSGFGIYTNSVGNLAIEDCTVRNFNAGIIVSANVASRFYLRNTVIRGCAFGLDVENATSGIIITAIVSGCQIDQCDTSGVNVVAAGSGASVDVTLADCILSGNGTAVYSSKTGAVVRANNCNITGNGIGIVGNSSGQVLSRGNNTLEKNDALNLFPGSYIAK